MRNRWEFTNLRKHHKNEKREEKVTTPMVAWACDVANTIYTAKPPKQWGVGYIYPGVESCHVLNVLCAHTSSTYNNVFYILVDIYQEVCGIIYSLREKLRVSHWSRKRFHNTTMGCMIARWVNLIIQIHLTYNLFECSDNIKTFTPCKSV